MRFRTKVIFGASALALGAVACSPVGATVAINATILFTSGPPPSEAEENQEINFDKGKDKGAEVASRTGVFIYSTATGTLVTAQLAQSELIQHDEYIPDEKVHTRTGSCASQNGTKKNATVALHGVHYAQSTAYPRPTDGTDPICDITSIDYTLTPIVPAGKTPGATNTDAALIALNPSEDGKKADAASALFVQESPDGGTTTGIQSTPGTVAVTFDLDASKNTTIGDLEAQIKEVAKKLRETTKGKTTTNLSDAEQATMLKEAVVSGLGISRNKASTHIGETQLPRTGHKYRR